MKIFVLILFAFFTVNIQSQISDFKDINFVKADNVAKLNEGENLYNLPLLTHKLIYKLNTDVEKFRAIYTWICNNIKGDYNMHTKVSRQRKKLKNDSISFLRWNQLYKKKVFKTLLRNKKTMCTGYAYLIKEMAKIANIECKIVDGYARTVTSNINSLEMANHSWNAVKLNNKWYLCDATWSSGYMNENSMFIKEFNDGYFLTEPNLFIKNHYPLDKKWILNTSETSESFINSPLVYSEIFKYKIIPTLPSKMSFDIKKNKEVDFIFKALTNNTIHKISLVSFFNTEEKTYKIYNIKKENGLLSFKCRFTKKGLYDIHLKIGNDIVATYTIKVTKS
ncbi:MAG: hypothetical protein JXQ93_05980 [Flavobacteriaceae bacterium]